MDNNASQTSSHQLHYRACVLSSEVPARHWAGCSVVKEKALVTQSCLILCDPMDCSPTGSSVHGILQARIREGYSLLRGIFPTQGSNLGFLHWSQILYYLSYQGSPSSGGGAGNGKELATIREKRPVDLKWPQNSSQSGIKCWSWLLDSGCLRTQKRISYPEMGREGWNPHATSMIAASSRLGRHKEKEEGGQDQSIGTECEWVPGEPCRSFRGLCLVGQGLTSNLATCWGHIGKYMQYSTFICKICRIDCRDFIRIKGYNVHSVASLRIMHTQTFLAQDMNG